MKVRLESNTYRKPVQIRVLREKGVYIFSGPFPIKVQQLRV